MGNTIYDYDQALTIDGATHWLLIQPGNNSVDYQRINRNTLLGVSAQPADISTSQTFSNKVLDNSNTITVKDSLFTLQDNLDTTKQAQFQLSGITTATTRTYTLPDASTTLVGTGTTQTLTAKTLTNPVITGGSISNTSIAVDSIAEYTNDNGVTIDGLNIKNGMLNTNNSVVTANITDSNITPAKLQSGTGSGWSWQSYAPTWTNVAVGNGTVTAAYIQTGKTVIFRIFFTLGTTTVFSGNLSVSLPVTASSFYSNAQPIGTTYIEDSGVQFYHGALYSASTTTANLFALNASSTYLTLSAVAGSVPFGFGPSDSIRLYGTYEAA